MTPNLDHLVIDLDDVCLKFVDTLAETVNESFDTDLTIEDFAQWDLTSVLNPIIGEDWWKWWKRQNAWAGAPPVRGVKGGLKRLREEGYYLEIVTSKPNWAEAATWEWQGREKLPVHRFTIIDMNTRKVDVSEGGIIIDDKFANVKQFTEAGRLGLLFNRPHNRSDEPTEGMIRVARWRDIPDALELVKLEVYTSA